jgi:hypothetical protein
MVESRDARERHGAGVLTRHRGATRIEVKDGHSYPGVKTGNAHG